MLPRPPAGRVLSPNRVHGSFIETTLRRKNQPFFPGALVILSMILPIYVPSAIADNDGQKVAKIMTVSDPAIPVKQLEWQVMPMTKDQLVVEADAWLHLLQEKVEQLAAVEIEIDQANRESQKAKENSKASKTANENSDQPNNATAAPSEDQAEAPAGAGEQSEAEKIVEQKTEEKLSAVERKVTLQDDRTKIVDRFNVVLASLKKKGGEVEPYEKYIAAVSGVQIDVSDAAAAWVAITGWLKSEEGGLRWARNIIVFILTILAFWILGRLAGKAVGRGLRYAKNISDLLRNFLINFTRRAVLVIGLIFALAQLEINIGPLVAAIGAAGFVVAFALQGTLSNFASGLLIMIYKPFDLGDAVEVGGESGTVHSMSLLSTTIKSFDNQTMVIPNNSVWDGVITNITGNATRRVDMVFGIGYADDADKARSILEDILAKHDLVLHDPAPVVKLHELADSSVNFVCRPWVKTPDYWTVKWDVTREVKKRFDDEGISIPFPQRDVHVYQEEMAKA